MAQTARFLLGGLLALALLIALPAAGQVAGEVEGDAENPIADAQPSEVALASFTTAVEGREPVDAVSFLSTDQTQIIFFSDLRDLASQTVTHRWEYNGQVMAEIPFEVKGDRWRVWSSKQLRPIWLGQWTASVVKADGEVIASESFTYQKIE